MIERLITIDYLEYEIGPDVPTGLLELVWYGYHHYMEHVVALCQLHRWPAPPFSGAVCSSMITCVYLRNFVWKSPPLMLTCG